VVTVISPHGSPATEPPPALWTPANTAGCVGIPPYIYGPHWFNDDLSVNKAIRIRESINLTLQAEFLNVTNHPTFSILNGGQNAPQNLNAQSVSFGQASAGQRCPESSRWLWPQRSRLASPLDPCANVAQSAAVTVFMLFTAKH